MILTAKILDVVVFLIEVEVEIAAALREFQPPGEHARFLGNSRLLTACTFLHEGLLSSDVHRDCL